MKELASKIVFGRDRLSGLLALSIIVVLGLGCICPPQENRNSSFTNNGGSSNSSPSNVVSNSTNSNSANTNPAAKPDLELVKSTWKKGGFGSVAIWVVTVRNNSNKNLGDIKFRTGYFSETGNKVGRGGVDGLIGKDTIEKIVPAKKTRTFEVNDGFVSDEAETAGFEIVSWREVP